MITTQKISKDELRMLPLLRFDGNIHLIDDYKKAKAACKNLSKSNLLGFDTEKKPTFKKGQYHPTALVQLADKENAYLFRTNLIGVPPQLKKILESDEIEKVGLGMSDDFENLQKMTNLNFTGFTDLADVISDLGIQQTGLRNLAGIFLEYRISKSQQTSNWENENLTESQKNYAALDAWACREIYSLLLFKGYI